MADHHLELPLTFHPFNSPEDPHRIALWIHAPTHLPHAPHKLPRGPHLGDAGGDHGSGHAPHCHGEARPGKGLPTLLPGGGAKEEEGVLVSSRGSSLELTLHLELEGVEGG